MENIKTHFRTCNLCEAMCGLEIKYSETNIISIKGDKKDMFSRGHICPKAVALQDLYHDKDRLKTPVKRTTNGWKNISWEEAFDEVVNRLLSIQKKYGNDAVGSYQGNPNVHNSGMMLFGTPFIKSLNSKQKYSATSVDQLPHHISSLKMFGHHMLIPIPDIDHTSFMLIIGGNPVVSNGSLMTAPDFANRLKAIQKRGGEFVVVDPRFTETAKIANQHLFIKPGKDALFLLALIHVIFEEKLTKKAHLESHINNWKVIKNLSTNFSPEKIAETIGIPTDEIKKLARKFALAKTAVCYGRLGVSTHEFGGVCLWLVNVLNIITDNFDKKGGAMFTLPAIDLVGMATVTGKTGNFDRYKSRVRNLPEYSGELPVATLADEICTEGKGQIKAMVTIAGNPVLSTPNGKHLAIALEQLEFMVAIDIYINETTQYADIILPSTTGLETSHYDLAFHQLAVRNTSKYSEILFDKNQDQKHDWEIFKELTNRMGGKDNPATPEIMIDYMLQKGPYKDKGLSVKKLKENPHGIDLGELKSCLPERLFTKDKKIELAPVEFVQDLNRLKNQLAEWKNNSNGAYNFSLIGRRHLRSNNSWMHNVTRLIKGKERCTLLINPEDAKILNIINQQNVTVSSKVGSLKIPIEISSEMMEGVVSIPHGWGHNYNGSSMRIAKKNAGVSINDLTDPNKIDFLTGNANFSGTKVKIERVK
ncbi:MAG: molybdopterin-dependent oxidoreductase [Flavobacteriaceae bacterium]|nr:molybdopterin-dependent oxidoreductase [Flavobacteriaceae bacterium]